MASEKSQCCRLSPLHLLLLSHFCVVLCFCPYFPIPVFLSSGIKGYTCNIIHLFSLGPVKIQSLSSGFHLQSNSPPLFSLLSLLCSAIVLSFPNHLPAWLLTIPIPHLQQSLHSHKQLTQAPPDPEKPLLVLKHPNTPSNLRFLKSFFLYVFRD